MGTVKYYNGRCDGLGNRIEEIVALEAVCDKLGIKIVYVWNNKHDHRRYPILFEAGKVMVAVDNGGHDFFSPPAEVKACITQADVLAAAKRIRPKFEIRFAGGIKPLGVHIRGTDRIGKDHPHFIRDYDEFGCFLSKTIYKVNSIKPNQVFICSDDEYYKKLLVKHLYKHIHIVEPVYDKVINKEYADFFALTLCDKIYMCSKFSSFSICASLIGNIPLVAFSRSEEVEKRYQALFEYDLEDIAAEAVHKFKFDGSTRKGFLKRLAPFKDGFVSLFRNS